MPEVKNKRKILVADGITGDKFTIGQGDKKTTIDSHKDEVVIDKAVAIQDSYRPEHAITQGQVERRIDDIVESIQHSSMPFIDVEFLASDFVKHDDGCNVYVVRPSDYGYTKAIVGEFGFTNKDGSIWGVEYSTKMLSDGSIEVHIQSEPFDGVARIILGGVDPTYADFANRMSKMDYKLVDFESRLSNMELGTSTGTKESSYSILITESDWVDYNGSYKYTIMKDVHKVDTPYVASAMKVQDIRSPTEHAEDMLVSYKIYIDERISIVVDEKINCKIIIRSR